jgi:hypothetical protein
VSVKAFKKTGIADTSIAKFQENVDNAFQPILASPILDGNLLSGVQLSSTATLVEHKLGREARGYLVVGRLGNVNVWNSAVNPAPKKFLVLLAASSVQVDLWVF